MTDRLREMIIKRAVDQHKGMDIDGDVLNYNGKQYFIHELAGIVEEVK